MELSQEITEKISKEIDELIRIHPRALAGMKFELFNFAIKVVEMTTPEEIAGYYENQLSKLEKDIQFFKGE